MIASQILPEGKVAMMSLPRGRCRNTQDPPIRRSARLAGSKLKPIFDFQPRLPSLGEHWPARKRLCAIYRPVLYRPYSVRSTLYTCSPSAVKLHPIAKNKSRANAIGEPVL